MTTRLHLSRAVATARQCYRMVTGQGRNLYTRSSSGINTILLQNPPVNVLSRTALKQLCDDLLAAHSDPSCLAVVLTGHGRVFSAGLDIAEFFGQTPDSIRAYLRCVYDTFVALYPARLPVIAAINGPAPAGGCWLALLSDYRIMTSAPKAVIGLNEVGLGITAPPMLREPLIHAAGYRNAERMLQLGLLLGPAEALRMGVVDEVVDNPDSLLPRAIEVARSWAAVPASARAATKLQMRQRVGASLAASMAADFDTFVTDLCSPGTQAILGKYLDSLKKKPHKAS